MSAIWNFVKRRLRDLYWWWKDRQLVVQICDNPITYLAYVPRDSDKIGVDVYVRSGISIEPKEKFGIGHLLEHYLSETVVRDLQPEIYSNGRINHEMMNLYARLEREKPKELIKKFLDKIFKISFEDAGILDYEKLAIQNELNTDTHNLLRRIERTVENGRFQDECFCIKSFEDSIEPTARLTLDDVERHYCSIFNKQNVAIFISAYNPSQTFISYLKEILPAYRLPEGKRAEYPPCSYSGRKAEQIEDKTITGSYTYLTFPALRSLDDPKEKIMLRMVLDLLTGRENDYSVNQRARHEGIYAVNNYWVRLENIGFIAFHSYIPKDKIPVLFGILGDSIRSVCQKPVSDAYIKRERRDLARIYRREWRSNDRVNWMIDEILDLGEFRPLEFYLEQLKSITPDDLCQLATRIFDPAKANIYVYGETSDLAGEELLKKIEAK